MTNNRKRYSDVRGMVRGLSEEPGFAEAFEKRLSERKLVRTLFALRNAKGFSQKDVADKLRCTQSRISKLEQGTDNDLRLGDLVAYADAIGLDVRIGLAKKGRTAVEQVKDHAFAIRRLLDHLAGLAATDHLIARGVSNFFGEAAFNLIGMLQDCANKLPPPPEGTPPYFQIELGEAEREQLHEADGSSPDDPEPEPGSPPRRGRITPTPP
jgi:transcriptional regulator with XRE-family HTH domain